MIEGDKNDTSGIKLEDARHNYHLKNHTTKKVNVFVTS
jgi:hypothetical protein